MRQLPSSRFDRIPEPVASPSLDLHERHRAELAAAILELCEHHNHQKAALRAEYQQRTDEEVADVMARYCVEPKRRAS